MLPHRATAPREPVTNQTPLPGPIVMAAKGVAIAEIVPPVQRALEVVTASAGGAIGAPKAKERAPRTNGQRDGGANDAG